MVHVVSNAHYFWSIFNRVMALGLCQNFVSMYFFFFEGLGGQEGLWSFKIISLILSSTNLYVGQNQKIPMEKKKHTRSLAPSIYIQEQYYRPFPPQTSPCDFEKPLNLSQKCWYSFRVIFRTTSLQVCCLPTQIFQAGLVGRKLFLLPVQVKDTILRLNYF